MGFSILLVMPGLAAFVQLRPAVNDEGMSERKRALARRYFRSDSSTIVDACVFRFSARTFAFSARLASTLTFNDFVGILLDGPFFANRLSSSLQHYSVYHRIMDRRGDRVL